MVEVIFIRCDKKLKKRMKLFMVNNEYKNYAEALKQLLDKWEGKPVRYT